jgi:hypothetical protein
MITFRPGGMAALAMLWWLAAPHQVARAQALDELVTIPGQSAAYFPIRPGATGQFTFEIRDTTGLGLSGALGGILEVPQAVFAQYTFTSLDPTTCSAPVLAQEYSATVVRFNFAAVDPMAVRRCRYRVDRAPNAISDLGFNACFLRSTFTFPFCINRARFGTLPNQDLVLETLGAGNPSATLLRLRLINRSSAPIESRVASTDCHEFGGGSFGPTAFDIDSNVAGGCPTAFGTACANFTAQLFDSRAYRIGPVAPGGTASCLLRVRSTGAVGAQQVPMFLFEDRVNLTEGALGFDPQRAGETVTIGLGLPGAVPVPVGPMAWAVLALFVLASAIAAMRAGYARVSGDGGY